MGLTKRILLFFIVNALVVLTVSVLFSLLGIEPYLVQQGLDMRQLAIFCLVWGMAGSLTSLALSRQMAKWMLRIELLSSSTSDSRGRWLATEVARLAHQAGLPCCPEVGIFHSSEPNAFATGPTRSRALVAVSSGLLEKMSQEELSAVLGHEISHVANGDMVTMTLLQGIVNAFVMFLSRILAYLLSGMGREGQRGRSSYGSFILFTMLFQTLFMLLGSLVIAYYSRRREFAADRGGASLAGRENMIAALERLKAASRIYDPEADKPSLEAFKIHTAKKPGRLIELLSSHPPLDLRIERLRENC